MIPKGKNKKNIGMWAGVSAVSRTAVWCHEPSMFGQKLAMMVSSTEIVEMRPQKLAIRRTSTSWETSRSTILRPFLMRYVHHQKPMTPLARTSDQKSTRYVLVNPGLDASIPIVHALPCIQRRMAAAMTMKTSGPTNVRRCPPHQSIGPLPGFDSTFRSGAAVATCAMNPPCAPTGAPFWRVISRADGWTPRHAQHNPDPVWGQEEKWNKAGTFRNVTNPGPLRARRTSGASLQWTGGPDGGLWDGTPRVGRGPAPGRSDVCRPCRPARAGVRPRLHPRAGARPGRRRGRRVANGRTAVGRRRPGRDPGLRGKPARGGGGGRPDRRGGRHRPGLGGPRRSTAGDLPRR